MIDQTATRLSDQARVLYDAVEFEPHKRQEEILVSDARFLLVTGGFQSGKSVTAGKKFLRELPRDVARAKADPAKFTFPLIYWLVAADYARTLYEFNYIRTDMGKLNLLHKASSVVNPGEIHIRGTRNPKAPVIAIVKTKSASDITTLSQESPVGIIICEASQLGLEAYWRIQERVSPRQAWLFMAGTMEGSLGWYPALHDEWATGLVPDAASFELPTYSNLALFPGGESDPEIERMKREFDEEFYNERVLGVPMPPQGLVIKDFRYTLHVKDVKYVPGHPVNMWIDPGYRRTGSVIAAHVFGEGTEDPYVTLIDEVYTRDRIDEEIIEICQAKPWWKDVPEGRHAVDIYAMQHHGRLPIAETWRVKAGINLHSHKVRDVNEGTAVLKRFLRPHPVTKEPMIAIAPHLKGLLSELGACLNPLTNKRAVYTWDVDINGETTGKTPRDRFNDSIKATIYGLIDRFGYVNAEFNKVRNTQRFSRAKQTRRTNRRRNSQAKS